MTGAAQRAIRVASAALVAVAGAATVAACAAPSAAPAEPLVLDRPVVLLGGMHDHPQQHALRADAFRRLLVTGARPVLAMEQFDRDRQADIDRLRAAASGVDADALIAAAGAPGWHWPYYRPYVALAIDHGLPLVAANVSRSESRALMRGGLAAAGFDAAVPADIAAAHTASIVASHCGLVDEATAARMALAQAARDQFMARVVGEHAARGVVLVAGNGHVRADIGVPRWLDAATRARTLVVGVVEDGDDDRAFDRRAVTPPHPRPDPCAAMRGAAASAPMR